MPPGSGWGGGGGNGGRGGRGGDSVGQNRGGVGGVGRAKDVQSREEIRKFLNFYKRKNSVCVDLYQPAFYAKKPSWEDLAEFVYSVLSVGSNSPPGVIRAAVKDVQLHPVKKLLFLKFSDQQIRDEVATRLQSGLVWPAFDTSVTGWAMDKPVERFRVLGASPETYEDGIRQVLQKYGEVLDAKKGLISPKKLPGCSNGIWTVKMILEKDQNIPPFLIMKEEGEVWQLATGEISVCWKCGVAGHIGDKCYQDVSALAASLVGPSVSQQPSWAHVVRGTRAGQHSHGPPAPPYPHLPFADQKLCVPITAGTLLLAKSKLVEVADGRFGGDVGGVNHYFRDEYVREQLDKKAKSAKSVKPVKLAADDDGGAEVGEAAVDAFVPGEIFSQINENQVLVKPTDVVLCEDVTMDGTSKVDEKISENLSLSVQVSQEENIVVNNKKAKFSDEGITESTQPPQPSSPDLPHKLPARFRLEGHSEDEESEDVRDGVHTNMFGFKFVMWFELSIEGKSAMDREEQDWGGKLEFGYSDNTFSKEIGDYFLLMEDECTIHSNHCAARVSSVVSNMRNSVLQPPSYDQRNIVDLLDRYGDAHIIDMGWREVDVEEWVEEC